MADTTIVHGPSFRFEMTLDREALAIQKMPGVLRSSQKLLLTVAGQQAVAWAVKDYHDRSRGGEAGGIQWDHITESAIVSRLRKRAPWKAQTDELLSLQMRSWPLLDELRKKLPAGEELGRNRGAIAMAWMQTGDGQALQKIRDRRAAIRKARKTKIANSLASAKIGIDTGRLINSLVAGVAELAKITVPQPEGDGEAVPKADFEISGDTIRLGSNMSYAGYFDERRPIFGDGFINADRQKKMDDLITLTIQQELKRNTGNGV